jgi:hypothetical protein
LFKTTKRVVHPPQRNKMGNAIAHRCKKIAQASMKTRRCASPDQCIKMIPPPIVLMLARFVCGDLRDVMAMVQSCKTWNRILVPLSPSDGSELVWKTIFMCHFREEYCVTDVDSDLIMTWRQRFQHRGETRRRWSTMQPTSTVSVCLDEQPIGINSRCFYTFNRQTQELRGYAFHTIKEKKKYFGVDAIQPTERVVITNGNDDGDIVVQKILVLENGFVVVPEGGGRIIIYSDAGELLDTMLKVFCHNDTNRILVHNRKHFEIITVCGSTLSSSSSDKTSVTVDEYSASTNIEANIIEYFHADSKRVIYITSAKSDPRPQSQNWTIVVADLQSGSILHKVNQEGYPLIVTTYHSLVFIRQRAEPKQYQVMALDVCHPNRSTQHAIRLKSSMESSINISRIFAIDRHSMMILSQDPSALQVVDIRDHKLRDHQLLLPVQSIAACFQDWRRFITTHMCKDGSYVWTLYDFA